MERERRILDAAAAVFAEKGFHGTGMDELGSRAGLNGPALYRHFSSKNEILAALFDEAMDELTAATVALHDDPATDLRRMIRHHLGFAIAHRDLVSVYQREDHALVDPWRRHFHLRRHRYVERWAAAVARLRPELDEPEVAVATQSCLGVIFSVTGWPSRLLRTDKTIDLVEGFVMAGVGRSV